MATKDFSTTGLVVTDKPRFTEYVGTKDQLICAGIAEDHEFPEGRKRVKYSCPSNTGFREARKIKGGKFMFSIWHEAEQKKSLDTVEIASFLDSFLESVISVLKVDRNSMAAIALAKTLLVEAFRSAKPAARLTLVK